MRLLKSTNTILALCFLGAVLLNFSSLNYYFFQDDWFVLNVVKNLNLTNILSIFSFRTDIIYYRPIGMQGFFLLANTLFGPNAFLFHSLNFAIFFLDIYLIYSLVSEISNNKKTGLIFAFLYSTAGFHFMTFSWLVLTWNFIGLAFFLISLKFLIRKRQIIAFMFFCFFLLSSEFALSYPFFALALFLKRDVRFKMISFLRFMWPFLLTIIVYLFVRIFIFHIPTGGTYTPTISLNVLKDYIWYFLWLLNVPELLKTHLNITEIKIATDFITDTNGLASLIPVLITLEITFLSLLFYKSKQAIGLKVTFTCIALFLISLAPVIFLPNHSYPYYLTIASIPILYLISLATTSALKANRSRVVAVLFLFSYIAASKLCLNIDYKTHWIPGEQSISRKIISQVTSSKFPENKLDSVDIYPSTSMTKLALMDQEAIKFIYNKNVLTNYLNVPPKGANNNTQVIIWDK